MKRIITLICFTLLVVSPLRVIRAPNGYTDVVVPRLEEPVDINGNIGMWEWSDAVKISVTFRFWNETQGKYVENRTAGISLKHNCSTLFILVSMSDSQDVNGSWLAVFYDADRDGSMAEDGDDEKAIIHPDTAFDIALVGVSWYNDTDLGGTHDVAGASGFIPVEQLTYEMAHPLDSGDSAGNDLSAPPGSMITAMFMAGDPEVDADYAVAFTEDGEYLYNLHITPCAVGGTIDPINPLLRFSPLIALTLLALTGFSKLMKSRRIAT